MCHKLGLQLVVHVPDEGVEASILVETVAEQSASRIEEVVVQFSQCVVVIVYPLAPYAVRIRNCVGLLIQTLSHSTAIKA